MLPLLFSDSLNLQFYLLQRSLKHYAVILFVKGLRKVGFLNYEHFCNAHEFLLKGSRKVSFLNYEYFSNIDAKHADFLNKLMKVIN